MFPKNFILLLLLQQRFPRNPVEETKKEMLHTEKVLRERIELINNEQRVRNEDVFGPVEHNETVAIIVVQVHTRLQYLQQQIISFGQVRSI